MFEQKTGQRKSTEQLPVRPVIIKRDRSHTGMILLILLAVVIGVGAYAIGVIQSSRGPDTAAPSGASRQALTGDRLISPPSADNANRIVREVDSTSMSPDTRYGKASTIYRSCREAREAGVTPMRRGDAHYNPDLDKDGDGVACETYYRSCDDVFREGKTGLKRGEPGYRPGLDRDMDGVAC